MTRELNWEGNNSKTSLDVVFMFIYVLLVCLHRVQFRLRLLFLYRQRLTHFLPLRITYCLQNGFSQGPRTCGTRVVFYSARKHEKKHI
jgi:hypothetical protein